MSNKNGTEVWMGYINKRDGDLLSGRVRPERP